MCAMCTYMHGNTLKYSCYIAVQFLLNTDRTIYLISMKAYYLSISTSKQKFLTNNLTCFVTINNNMCTFALQCAHVPVQLWV